MAAVPEIFKGLEADPPPPPQATNTAAAAGSKTKQIAFFNIHDLPDEKITDQSILLKSFNFWNPVLVLIPTKTTGVCFYQFKEYLGRATQAPSLGRWT
jgi:hypothetical protein